MSEKCAPFIWMAYSISLNHVTWHSMSCLPCASQFKHAKCMLFRWGQIRMALISCIRNKVFRLKFDCCIWIRTHFAHQSIKTMPINRDCDLVCELCNNGFCESYTLPKKNKCIKFQFDHEMSYECIIVRRPSPSVRTHRIALLCKENKKKERKKETSRTYSTPMAWKLN